MSNPDPRIPNMPWLSPYLGVSDPQKSIEFYQQAFGFKLVDQVKDEQGQLKHVEMRHKDAVVMFAPVTMFGDDTQTPAASNIKPSICLYVYCDDVDSMFNNAVKHGATPTLEPQVMHWGDRMCALTDPDGYNWSFATNTSSSAELR